MKRTARLLAAVALLSFPAYAEEPPLPAGLGGPSSASSEPALPAGLRDDEPVLPAGLDETGDEWADSGDEDSSLPFNLTGFVDMRGGVRLQNDAHENRDSLAETRLQLQLDKDFERFALRLTSDFLYDAAARDHSLDLEHGEGLADLREAYVSFRPLDFADVKAGRQILTWGTGDLLFLNDMFPKDWVSFFTGRDVEYLKAPSDALRVSLFSGFANLDVVYTPQFDADRYIDGNRISFYNSGLGRLSGRDMPVTVDPRGHLFSEDEIAGRLYRTFGAFETALYGYSGYWKSPAGQDAQSRATFPSLSVVGASVRGPIFKGIGNIEVAFYDSKDDEYGTNPAIRNGEIRTLVGYEQELMPELTGGIQYYVEHMRDYDEYIANLPAGAVKKEQDRHMVTLRLTKLMMNQNLNLSLFNFYSPTDDDGYVRPKVSYKVNDNWSVSAGANMFYGARNNTFWGQFEDNSNIYAGIRYSF